MQEEIDEEEARWRVACAVVAITLEQHELVEQAKSASREEADRLRDRAAFLSTKQEVARRTQLPVGHARQTLHDLGVKSFWGDGRFTTTREQLERIDAVSRMRIRRRAADVGVTTNNSVTLYGAGHQVSAGGDVTTVACSVSEAIAVLRRHIRDAHWPEPRRSEAHNALEAFARISNFAEGGVADE